ncbi:MAG: lysostaphin resistance A-like protein, partial [Cellulosilyticaceae bacterium]
IGIAIFIEGLIYGVLFMGTNLPAIAYGYLGVIAFTIVYMWTGSIWGGVIVQFSSTLGIFALTAGNMPVVNHYNADVYMMLGAMMLTSGIVWLRLQIKGEKPFKQGRENVWRGIGFVGVAMTVLMFGTLGVDWINAILIQNIEGFAPFIYANRNLVMVLYFTVGTLVMALIMRRKKEPLLSQWHVKAMSPKNVLLISCMAIGISLFTTSLTSIRAVRTAFPVFEEYMSAFMNDMPHLGLQIFCIIAIPLVEEVFFRGILFYPLRKRTNLIFAMAVSILIYAATQGDIIIGLYSILGSAVYTLCFEFGDSLWGAVLIQEVSAILMMVIRRTKLVQGFMGLPDSVLVILCIVSLIAIVGSFVLLYKGYKGRQVALHRNSAQMIQG